MKNWSVVWKKEMLDALRDPRTVFFMVIFPLVLYPLMIGFISQKANSENEAMKATDVRVAVQAPAPPELLAALKAGSHLQAFESKSASDDVKARRADVGIVMSATARDSLLSGHRVRAALLHDAGRDISKEGRDRTEEALKQYGLNATRTYLEAHGLPSGASDPVEIEHQDVSPPEKKLGLMLASFLPYFLALAIANGSVSTAIDTTAGEKDRSTLETVLVSSTGRSSVLIGKLLAVVTTALIATLSSAAGIGVAILRFKSFGGDVSKSGVAMEIPYGALLGVVLLALPVALLLSAILICLGCFAKSAREGQMMAVSLQMVVIIGGISSMFQQTVAPLKTFMIPVLGTALVQKELLRGELDPTHLMVAVVSSLALAGIAVAIAVRLFGNERLMFRAK